MRCGVPRSPAWAVLLLTLLALFLPLVVDGDTAPFRVLQVDERSSRGAGGRDAVEDGDDIYLRPLSSSQGGKPLLLIIVQGAQVTTKAYEPLAYTIQTTLSPLFSVWLAIPSFPDNMAYPNDILTTSQAIDRVQTHLHEMEGMPSNTPRFLLGHSLGGAAIQEYSRATPNGTVAQILLGAFMQGSVWDTTLNPPYPTPTLTIAAELDGLCRISRVAESWYRQRQVKEDFPVVVVEGMNHMQFASGPPPVTLQEYDLMAEITLEEAHQQVSVLVSSFVRSRLLSDEAATSFLHNMAKAADALLSPLLESLELEGSYWIKPPCYDNDPGPHCRLGCPWIEKVVQPYMAGLEAFGVQVWVNDEYHPVNQYRPTVHLPKIITTCPSPSDCPHGINMTTVTDLWYYYNQSSSNQDPWFDPPSADELRCKLSSRQASYQSVGLEHVSFDETDGPSLCADINELAYQWALDNVPVKTVDRFKRRGEPLVFGQDIGPLIAGPLWVNSRLVFREVQQPSSSSLQDARGNDGVWVMEVRSPVLKTPTDYLIKAAAGYHYCKVLSPARAMEWVYLDGLRRNMSTNTTSTTMRHQHHHYYPMGMGEEPLLATEF